MSMPDLHDTTAPAGAASPAATVPSDGLLASLESVGKIYGRGSKRFVALQGVDLAIRAGEFVCLLGPSGCGKSTIVRLVTGLTRPTSGAVLYRGRPLDGVNPHATIVFQTFALYPWLTVEENVDVALKALRPERREIRRSHR
jgi:NitT/TauT family transport system ATP-binding protein